MSDVLNGLKKLPSVEAVKETVNPVSLPYIEAFVSLQEECLTDG